MAILTERFIVVEQEPLRGVDPQVRYFDTAAEARAYVLTRAEYFGRIDVAAVRVRLRTAYVRQTSEESED